MAQLYDTIGRTYRNYRQPDRRIGESILAALGNCDSTVNVGAGSGSYEPDDRFVVAVEPSMTMIKQRSEGAAPVVQGTANALPFRDETFDAALAILTIHHWPDKELGLQEMKRVARERVVLLSWDSVFEDFWLHDYLPTFRDVDRRLCVSKETLEKVLGPVSATKVPVPHDCSDGFAGAYWRRPEAYLDPGVRSAISTFSRIGDPSEGLAKLKQDLDDGTWDARYGHLRGLEELDLGYRVYTAHVGG
jgi:SAM-dependent methyltransferase